MEAEIRAECPTRATPVTGNRAECPAHADLPRVDHDTEELLLADRNNKAKNTGRKTSGARILSWEQKPDQDERDMKNESGAADGSGSNKNQNQGEDYPREQRTKMDLEQKNKTHTQDIKTVFFH
jgi:septum formation inhibitor MinC